MKSKKARLIIGIITIILFVIVVIDMFASPDLIDNLEGDNGDTLQNSAYMAILFSACMLIAGIFSFVKMKLKDNILFILSSIPYLAAAILGFIADSNGHTGMFFFFGVLTCLIIFLIYIIGIFIKKET